MSLLGNTISSECSSNKILRLNLILVYTSNDCLHYFIRERHNEKERS